MVYFALDKAESVTNEGYDIHTHQSVPQTTSP